VRGDCFTTGWKKPCAGKKNAAPCAPPPPRTLVNKGMKNEGRARGCSKLRPFLVVGRPISYTLREWV
jgi:hypothetical protein